MADILIRGMEMPKDCEHCRFSIEGWCYAYGKPNGYALVNVGRTNFCPLLPLPEKHGRLIDADELCAGLVSNHPVVIYAKNAPTIVPAEGGGDDGN